MNRANMYWNCIKNWEKSQPTNISKKWWYGGGDNNNSNSQTYTYRKLFTLIHNNIRIGFRTDRVWVNVCACEKDREWVRCWSLLYLLCAYHTLVRTFIYIHIDMYMCSMYMFKWYIYMWAYETKMKTILSTEHITLVWFINAKRITSNRKTKTATTMRISCSSDRSNSKRSHFL